jgi:hypothetical protein
MPVPNLGDTMTRSLRAITLLLAPLALAACASSKTTLTMKWKEPSVTELRFSKIVTVGVSADARWREIVEDELSYLVRNAVPAYSVIPADAVRDIETAKKFIKGGGYDAAVVLRLVGVDKETTYYSGAGPWWPDYYGSMWGYWGYAWPAVYDPGYMSTTRYVTVEALIYRVADEKLLFAARSRTSDPSSTRALTGEVTKAVRDELMRQKLIPPPAK